MGTTNSVIAVLEGERPEVISNTEGGRTTPSVVAFRDNNERLVGQLAKRQSVMNPTKTFSSVKRFIGRSFDEVTEEMKLVPYKVVPGTNNTVKFQVDDKGYAPEEISAQVLRKMVDDAAKYLCSFGRVIYDSLEESTGLSFQMSLKRHKMGEVKKKLIILDREPMEQLEERLRRRGSPGIVIIDSFQYSGLNYKTYKEFKERHPKKLFIFISHAEGLHPAGRSARKVEYDADVKIMVSCFKAWCKSRFMERPGEPYVIWEEGAAKTLKDDNMEDYLNGMGE